MTTGSATTTAPAARAVYEERRDRFGAEARALEDRSRRLGNARVVAFLLALAAFLAPVLGAPASLHRLSLALVAAFLVLVPIHRRIDRRRDEATVRRQLNEEALHRLAREWDRVPEPRFTVTAPPAFARDLDVFGHASLWKLLGTAATPVGKATLARWLLAPAAPAEIARRQAAVRELAPRLDFRQELQLRVRALEKLDPDVEPFLRWAEGGPWLAHRPGRKWVARGLPILLAALFAGSLAGLWPHHLWLLLGLFNLAWSAFAGKEMPAIFRRISAREGEFREAARGLELLVGETWLAEGAPLLAELRGKLVTGGLSAPQQMERLHGLVALSDVRHSGSLHGLVQALTLWDFHVLDRLERWQAEAGHAARTWLEALGEVEALGALAGVHHDEPDGTFPEILPAAAPGAAFEARRLGHPLLAPDVRVPNDVTVGPAGTFLLVTGSNMSGKSTLLRALGLNAVLAQAGGAVCAGSLRLPPLEVATSVLIEDSLEDGVSFFMAELRRVKEIVDRSASCRQRGRVLFYLMDEILRGTNSEERQVAVRKVLIHLLHQGALGAVATHDLNLAEIAELAGASRPVHFRETLADAAGGPVMTFDYVLRPGVATTRNALKLLEIVGLDLEA